MLFRIVMNYKHSGISQYICRVLHRLQRFFFSIFVCLFVFVFVLFLFHRTTPCVSITDYHKNYIGS